MRPIDAGDAGQHPPLPGPPAELGPFLAAPGPMVPRSLSGPGLPARPLPPAMTAALNAAVLLKVLRRHWALALGLGLLCGAAASAAAWVLVPAKYSARAMLHAATRTPNLLTGDGPGGGSGSNFKNFLKTQQAMVLSGTVLKEALLRPNPYKAETTIAQVPLLRAQADPIYWLQNHLDVESEGEILSVALDGDADPRDLEVIVNAVTYAYLDQVVNHEQADRQARHTKLSDIYKNYRVQLKERRNTLRNLAETMGSSDKSTLTLKQQFALERLSLVEKELTQQRANLKRAQAERRALQQAEQGRGDVPVSVVDEAIARDPEVQRYQGRIGELQAAYDSHRRIVRYRNDPGLQKIRHEIATIRESMKRRMMELHPAVLTRLREEAQRGAPTGAQDAATQMAILEQFIGDLEKERADLEKKNQALFNRSADVDAMKDDIDQDVEAAARVGQQMQQLEVELQAPARVTLLAEANVPKTKEIKRQVIATVGAGLAALSMALLCLAWWQVRAGRIDSVDEVTNGLGLRVVGSLPAQPARARRAIDGAHGAVEVSWRNQLTESVNAMRALLLRLAQDEPLQVVLVTSAVGGEGKTTLSSHLATSLARAGRRTLLVDGDLRKAAVHRVFDLPQGPGLAELLRGEVEPADAIRPTLVDKLWMIPAGHCDEQALQALGQEDIRALFDRLRAQYDFIIVDTSPVLAVADALLLSQHVDGVIFSILGDVSRIPRVYNAYERMAALGARMLGAVVIGARGPSHTYASDYPYAASAGR